MQPRPIRHVIKVKQVIAHWKQLWHIRCQHVPDKQRHRSNASACATQHRPIHHVIEVKKANAHWKQLWPIKCQDVAENCPKTCLGRLISQHVAVPTSLFQHQTTMSSTPQGLSNQRSRRSRTHPSHSKLAPSAPSKAPLDTPKRTPRRHPDPVRTPLQTDLE